MSPLDATGRAQTVLLLGARSGIGQAIVDRLVSDGARTVLLAGREGGEAPSPRGSTTIEHLHFDATDTESHAKFFDEVFTRHHSIDVVIVAFGVLHDRPDPQLGVEMAEVNYVGAMSALLHASQHLRQQGSGQLVVLSSVAGVVPRRSNFVYGSTKAGLDFLSRGLAQSLSDTEVRTLLVRAGFVHTDMTADMKPAPLAVPPKKVAEAVAEAMTRRQSVIWVPPALRWVMTILKFLPPRLVEKLEG